MACVAREPLPFRSIVVPLIQKAMKKIKFCIVLLSVLSSAVATAQNPVIRDQFTADPTARVFNDRVYLYPSHDIPSPIEN